MKIDYKKELESASKSMIMIHDPRLLIKLIIRTIVRKLEVRHAGMILFEPKKNMYILDVSQGESGIKAPQGFMRFSEDNPIIKLFKNNEFKHLTFNRGAIVSADINKMIWRESVVENGNGGGIKDLLHKVDDQMKMLNAVACVPAYFQEDLLAVLLLGEKVDKSAFSQEELNFFSALASDAAMAIRNAQLFEDLSKEAARNKKLFIQVIIALSSAIEAKDAYTKGHTERVTSLALVLARQMELNQTIKPEEGFMENLYIAGLLHDIGKIAVPEVVLNKPGRLTNEEYEIIKKHPLKGVEIIESLEVSEQCLNGIKFHHERYDGTGYPYQLKGDEIPMIACIIAVADSFDAMTTDRPYRAGFPKENAIEEVVRCSGTQFHPLVVSAIEELWTKGLL